VADPFVAEIRIFPFNFAPTGWAFCDGQVMPISQNTALFSLLGTTYGGNGKSTFALPDLQGRAGIQAGQGQGLSDYSLGEQGGTESVVLQESQIPAHAHTVRSSTSPGDLTSPGPDRALGQSMGGFAYQTAASPTTAMAPEAITDAGASMPHNNMMPYLTLNFCIALQGVFPPRG
jgi:microcystin-dependent protein